MFAVLANRKKSERLAQIKSNPGDGAIAYGGLIDEYHDPVIARGAIKLGALAVAAFFLWAAFSPVHEISVGTGQILPTGFVQQVQHLEGGIVSKVLVSDGQQVDIGQPLVRLDDLAIRAELGKAKARAESIRLEIERQQTSSNGGGGVFEGDLHLRDVVNNRMAASKVEGDFRSAQLAVVEAQISRQQTERAAIELRRAKLNEEHQIVARQLADFQAAYDAGAISRKERDAVARDKIRLESEISQINGDRASLEAAILEAQARLVELNARFRQEAVGAITHLELQRAETIELIAQLQDKFERTIIRAPVAGAVHNLAVHNPGQVISPSGLVAEIVPGSGSVFAEVDIPSDQIGYVAAGMDANIKVLTFDFARFGAINGTVTDISPSSIMKDDGSSSYRIRLRLDTIFVGDPSEGRRVLPGMSVTADLKLGEKSVLSYLLKPLRAISDRALTER